MKHITRREFIKGSATLAGYACCSAAFGTLGSSIAFAQSNDGNGRTMIVCHFDGGNDWHQSFDVAKTHSARSAYESVHPTSKINAALVRATADGYGLHPSLAGLHAMYLNGDVRIIRRIGTLSPSRSHETEQLKFQNGDIDDNGLGWMGRVMDSFAKQGSVSRFMTMAIDQGNPLDIQGAQVRGLGVRDLTSYSLSAQINSTDQRYRQFISRTVLSGTQATTPLVNASLEGQKKMYSAIDTLQAAASAFNGRPLSGNPTLGAQYPTQRPGPQLRQIAMLIRAGLGTKLALCGMGGFDLHSEIGNEVGNEANLMRNLDYALTAFRNDMVDSGHWNSVCFIADSEFGRTITENGSGGTDHGASSALLIAGGGVNGGVSGSAVTGDEFLRKNNRPDWVPVRYHFANVYEEALDWLGLPSQGIFGAHPITNFNLF